MRYSLLIFIFAVAFCILFQAGAVYEPSVRIHSIMTDPTGTDTANEYIVLFNTANTSVDISGWDLDADQLPYFTFPSNTVLLPNTFLKVHLRQNGVSDAQNIFTGSNFGSTNMGNTKGMVALFRSTAHDAPTLEDYVQWGASHQIHSNFATQAGFFDAELFVTPPPEGQAIVIDIPVQNTSPSVGSGTIQEEIVDDLLEPIQEQLVSPRLRIAYVAFNNPTGIADYIGLYIEEAGSATSTGRLLDEAFVQVDTQKFSLKDIPAKSGDILHISVGSGAWSEVKESILQVTWPQLSGLVSTTEQLTVFTKESEIADGICWERMPIPQNETQDHEVFKRMFWNGVCLNSTEVGTGIAIEQDVELALYDLPKRSDLSFWQLRKPLTPVIEQSTQPQVQSNTNTNTSGTQSVRCTVDHAQISISEFLPNPEADDTGKEWIELYNGSLNEITLCGLLLDDGEEGSKAYDITGYRIPPKGYLVLPDSVSKISLGNTNDSVRLLFAAGGVHQVLTYENAPSGKSYSKIE